MSYFEILFFIVIMALLNMLIKEAIRIEAPKYQHPRKID
jgi:hypothetical protein